MDTEAPRIVIAGYPASWKAFAFNMATLPEGFREWRNMIWGTDIWFGWLPLCKTLVAVNILVWTLFV